MGFSKADGFMRCNFKALKAVLFGSFLKFES